MSSQPCGGQQQSHGNMPRVEYEDASCPPQVRRKLLDLPTDGPPGIMKVTLTDPSPALAKELGKSRGCVLCCAGVYSCLEGPSCLYDKLASLLPKENVAVLQVTYRPPGEDEEEAAEDVMTCIDWLVQQQLGPLVLIGWSMGAAAVIEAAYLRRTCCTCSGIITLAGQTAGTRNVKHLECPLLALHGDNDHVLPASCSQSLARRAKCGQFHSLPNSTHHMENALPHVLEFLQTHLLK